MSKRPFGKILKSKKQQPIQTEEQQQDEKKQSAPNKPTIGKLKLDTNKQKKNIYDAIKKVDQDKQALTTSSNPTVLKPTLNFKKNTKLLKNQPNSSLNKNQTQENQNNDELQDSNSNVQKVQQKISRPTPVFNRNKGKLLLGNKSKQTQKQKPIIQKQQQYNPLQDYYVNNNRLIDPTNQQKIQSAQMNNVNELNEEEKQKKLIKPTLFKKAVPTGGMVSQNQNQTKLLNNSEVYQEYDKGEPIKQKFNFQKMMNIQTAQINLQKVDEFEISTFKLEKQNKRTRQLSSLLNLEEDLYESMLSINSTTVFEVYINKIKSGFLKNSSDQAFDEKSDSSCQTLSFESVDFSNQCPQDYQQSHQYKYQENPEEKFNNFILNLSPVIEQLIKPSKQIIMPPISLLAFNPIFVSYKCCPTPVFIYYSEQYNLSLLVINQKLYITEDEISSVLDLNGVKIGGLKNGRVVLWNGDNNRTSKVYSKIQEILQSQYFQLPSYITNDLDRLSPYFCEGDIVDILKGQKSGEFYTLDSTCKLIKWTIETGNKKTILSPKQLLEFSKILQKRHLIGYNLKQRNQILYINTSSGLILWSLESNSIFQKISTSLTRLRDFSLPKRSNLILCLTSSQHNLSNTLRIYSLDYQDYIKQIRLESFIPEQFENNINVQQVIIPQLEHDNREISIFYCIYILYSNGSIYEMKLNGNGQGSDINLVECNKLLSEGESKAKSSKNLTADDEVMGNKSKRSNVIFNGVNILPFTGQIEKIRLFRDLKCVTEQVNMRISLDKNVNNLKAILMRNKAFVAQLHDENMILV